MTNGAKGEQVSKQQKLWYLRRLNLFEGLTPTEFEAVAGRLKDRCCARCETVLNPSKPSDRIYLVKDGGIVTSLNKHTGEVLKQGRLREAMDRYFASPVGADGKVFMASEPGVISVLRHGDPWEVLAVNKLDGECHATPVIMDGKLYVRTSKALYCFGKN